MRICTCAALAVAFAMATLGCSEGFGDGDPVMSPVDTNIPTFIEHLDASGAVSKVAEPAEGWDGSYPVRIVQQDESGEIVSEKGLARAPGMDAITEAIEQMTPAQRDQLERMLEAAATTSPPPVGVGLTDDEARKIQAGAVEALDELRKIRGKVK